MCTNNAQTNLLCSSNTFLLLKHWKQLLQKYFLFSFFCFVKHKSVKIFDVHVIWLVFISHKQQIHRIFKFLIWNVNSKTQFILTTIHVNANVLLFLSLAKIFFSHRKFNPIIIKTISKFFIVLCDSFWMYFFWINMPNMTPKKTLLIFILR